MLDIWHFESEHKYHVLQDHPSACLDDFAHNCMYKGQQTCGNPITNGKEKGD